MKVCHFFSLGALLSIAFLTYGEEFSVHSEDDQIFLQEEHTYDPQKKAYEEEPDEALIEPKNSSLQALAFGGFAATAGIASLAAAYINVQNVQENGVKGPDKLKAYSTAIALFYIAAHALKEAYTAYTTT